MSKSQEKYLQELAKYSDVILNTSTTYVKKSLPSEKIKILEVQEGVVVLENVRTGNIFTKTTHWCRKNLVPSGE
jgi:hypothetical protein